MRPTSTFVDCFRPNYCLTWLHTQNHCRRVVTLHFSGSWCINLSEPWSIAHSCMRMQGALDARIVLCGSLKHRYKVTKFLETTATNICYAQAYQLTLRTKQTAWNRRQAYCTHIPALSATMYTEGDQKYRVSCCSVQYATPQHTICKTCSIDYTTCKYKGVTIAYMIALWRNDGYNCCKHIHHQYECRKSRKFGQSNASIVQCAKGNTIFEQGRIDASDGGIVFKVSAHNIKQRLSLQALFYMAAG